MTIEESLGWIDGTWSDGLAWKDVKRRIASRTIAAAYRAKCEECEDAQSRIETAVGVMEAIITTDEDTEDEDLVAEQSDFLRKVVAGLKPALAARNGAEAEITAGAAAAREKGEALSVAEDGDISPAGGGRERGSP